MSIRILSIDGGGIKGIISAKILCALEDMLCEITGRKNVYIANYFDLIAGTSTGGILTAMLLCPDENGKPKFKANDCLNMYLKYGGYIFDKSVLRSIFTLGGLFNSKYPCYNLENVLDKYFKDLRLSQLLKPCLISAYDIENRRCVFFNKTDTCNPARDYPIKHIIRATSAAPTYFPVENCCTPDIKSPMIDGGVFANNPSLCAITEAARLNGKTHFCDMFVLSLGNVVNRTEISYKSAKNWGKLNWVSPLIDIIMDGVNQTVDYQMKTLFKTIGYPNNYLRISDEYNIEKGCPTIKMDDVSDKNICTLLEISDDIIKCCSDKLYKFALKLI